MLIDPLARVDNRTSQPAGRLTSEYLGSAQWGPEHQKGKYIKFTAGGDFDCTEDFLMDSSRTKGTYALKNDRLTLVREGNGGPFLRDGRLVSDPNSLRFSRFIVFAGGEKLWDTTSAVPAGNRVTIEGVPGVTMGMKKAAVTTNAKFRVKPDMKAKELTFGKFKEGGEGLEEETLPYLPAGTKIVVLARTVKTQKVQQWNNYWYYIDAEGPFDAWKQGWVFAELVKLD